MAGIRDYGAQKELCKDFLQEFRSEHGKRRNATRKYVNVLQDISNRTKKTLEIELDDVFAHFTEDEAENFINNIKTNTKRYMALFAEAADELLPEPTSLNAPDDVFDVLTRQRREQHAQNADPERPADQHQVLPAELTRRFEVHFKPLTKEVSIPIREVKAAHIGHLVTIKGIVTRVNDVKPLMTVATYTCDECGFEIYQEITSSTYMPIGKCPSMQCQTNKDNGHILPQTRGSKFVKFQEIKIQEMAEHVPMGHIPRTLTVHLVGELTRQVAPGEVVSVTGVYLPATRTGFRAMRSGLTADTYLEAMHIHQYKKSYTDFVLTPELRRRMDELNGEGDAYDKLSQSIAPEIFGHEDVKKALLLLLCGGVTAQLSDGMKLRGDIHVCLMGDPGVAKSQLLKHIATVAPRGVYTTGRGSSGVGLTAAVQRDPITNEMVLEGGALVLADKGICCIDEFDKMEEGDRTSIHEVMEQQTVSIAKAGITTTLNARTAVLAAANPAYSSWNPNVSPAENISMPAALLSRFDLMWVLLDDIDTEKDVNLAKHVLHVHRHMRPPALSFTPVDSSTIRTYIARARTFNPTIPKDLTQYIAGTYAELRQAEEECESPDSYTTARTLLSILRLSQALARIRFSEEVEQRDVDEALRLMKMSKLSIEHVKRNKPARMVDPVSAVYSLIKDMHDASSDSRELAYADVKKRVNLKGFTDEVLEECLDTYARLNLWMVNDNMDITFIARS